MSHRLEMASESEPFGVSHRLEMASEPEAPFGMLQRTLLAYSVSWTLKGRELKPLARVTRDLRGIFLARCATI